MKLRHPNVVRGFQVGLAAGLHYLVMEHLEGETLEDILVRRGRLLPAEAVRVVYQALHGLQHIHSQGLVHRDLKPSNLMIVSAGGLPARQRLPVRSRSSTSASDAASPLRTARFLTTSKD